MSKRRMPRHSVIQPEDQSIRLIPLTQGQNAMVDVEDYERLNQYIWHTTKGEPVYAARSEPGKTILMHREILNVIQGEVDHRNHNGLDNRRSNLRPCNRQQNCANTRYQANKSGFRGVKRHKNRWKAQIVILGQYRHIGSFLTPEEAAFAYDKAAKEAFGEFAFINFPS